MMGAIGPAWKAVVLQPTSTTGEPSDQALPGLLGQLELNRLLGFLLDYCCPVSRGGVHHKLTDAELHQIAPAQLAIDREIKESKVSDPLLSRQVKADRPDLLRLERGLWSDKGVLVPGHNGLFSCDRAYRRCTFHDVLSLAA
jgi:hypothetical protein